MGPDQHRHDGQARDPRPAGTAARSRGRARGHTAVASAANSDAAASLRRRIAVDARRCRAASRSHHPGKRRPRRTLDSDSARRRPPAATVRGRASRTPRPRWIRNSDSRRGARGSPARSRSLTRSSPRQRSTLEPQLSGSAGYQLPAKFEGWISRMSSSAHAAIALRGSRDIVAPALPRTTTLASRSHGVVSRFTMTSLAPHSTARTGR